MITGRISSKGQLVIPKGVREILGLQGGSVCRMTVEDSRLIIEPMTSQEDDWRRWRGYLKGTGAVQAHLRDHREEIERDAGRA